MEKHREMQKELHMVIEGIYYAKCYTAGSLVFEGAGYA